MRPISAELRLREDELFSRWRAERPTLTAHFVTDGAVDPEAFARSERRILFILKEVNGTQGGWDLRWGLQNRLENWRTWSNLARWAVGLSSPEAPEWGVVRRQDTGSRRAALRSVAVINIKKVPGKAVADDHELHSFALENRTFLREQISLYSPDITVACGTHWYLADVFDQDELGAWRETASGFCYRRSAALGVLLRFVHPQSRRLTAADMYRSLTEGAREALATDV